MDINDKVDTIAGIVSDLRVEVASVVGRTANVEQWISVLKRDVATLEHSVDRIETKIDASLKQQIEIVRDASARVPKWAMWMFGTIGTVVIAVVGWLIEAIIFHHP